MKHVIRDFRYAIRQIRQSPGFAITAVLTLALGIAANTTILSWIGATLFNPIPGAQNTGRMLSIEVGERSEHPTPPLSYADFADIRASTHTFAGMAAEHQDFISITGGARPERIFGELTSADYFEVLGVKPHLGRTLISTRNNERAGAPIAVLSYHLWQERFGGDPNVVGKTIQLNLHPYTVVGVAPQGFHGMMIGLRSDIFLPLGMAQQVWGFNPIVGRGNQFFNVFGVLRPGADAHEADDELNLQMQQLVAQYPKDHPANNLVSTDPLWRSPFGVNVYLAGTLPILLALAAVLLLLACANVTNLLLVRTLARRREFAIRLSMGANRWRLVRQLLLEDLLVGVAGGGLALLATFWSAKTLAAFLPITSVPLAVNGQVGGMVLWGTIAVSLVTALVSGVVPAIRASQLAPVAVLKDEALSTSGGLGKSRLASGLVIAQVALSLLLLACAGLFVRSLEAAQRVDPGFESSHVLLTTFDLDPLGYTDKTGTEFQRQVMERVKQLPGVETATLADFSPLSFTIHSEGALPEGYVPHLHESMEVDRGLVGPGYLHTLRTPLIAGRDIGAQDTAEGQQVAMVNQAFVDRYWPGQSAVGKHIFDGHVQRVVVGVAGNGKYRRLVYDPAPLVIYPLAQRYENEVILHVRTQGDPQAMAFAVQQAIHQLNANLPLYNVTTLDENRRNGSVFERLAVTFAGGFGALALLLAAIGLYGVVSYTARQRTHEIGIRMALGADKADVFRNVLGQGLRLTVTGLGAGLIAAFLLTRFVRTLLFGVGTVDWLTFAVVSVALCAVALLACYLPARRAAHVEPMQALRTE